jgi:hypothetical protein
MRIEQGHKARVVSREHSRAARRRTQIREREDDQQKDGRDHRENAGAYGAAFGSLAMS